MAINAVHSSVFGSRDLFRRKTPVSIIVFSDVSLSVFNFYPRNDLTLIVGVDVRDFIGNVHMPMYAGNSAGSGTAAADVKQHAYLATSVLFVVGVVIENFHLRAKELFRPVTLFTGVGSGSKVVYRRFDRTRVLIKTHGIELIGTGYLGSGIPTGA